jgi:small subunit ribosomal protein S21|tara:strand:- start:1980 stop:2174 length:195 start_codon:yes stop_codon:yes gene_type:complete
MSNRAVNAEVFLRTGETTEKLIRRFGKKVRKERIIEEYRDRMYYEKPSDKKRKKKKLRKLKNEG